MLTSLTKQDKDKTNNGELDHSLDLEILRVCLVEILKCLILSKNYFEKKW